MAVLGNSSLTGCNSIPDFIAAGSLMLFQQTTAPTSWTKQTTHNNKALRVVSGAASSGGNVPFSDCFYIRYTTGSVSVSGTNSSGSVSAHTLTTEQIPSHTHTLTDIIGDGGGINVGSSGHSMNNNPGKTTGSAGGDGSHTHGFTNPTWSGSASFSSDAMNFFVEYVDLIICSKN